MERGKEWKRRRRKEGAKYLQLAHGFCADHLNRLRVSSFPRRIVPHFSAVLRLGSNGALEGIDERERQRVLPLTEERRDQRNPHIEIAERNKYKDAVVQPANIYEHWVTNRIRRVERLTKGGGSPRNLKTVREFAVLNSEEEKPSAVEEKPATKPAGGMTRRKPETQLKPPTGISTVGKELNWGHRISRLYCSKQGQQIISGCWEKKINSSTKVTYQ
ncbi:hypothetical protein B0H16DRAFT_1455073 [Mycena metata]|uniref:Uncharacterized protein n=1 Tax=Mycena metata TaxID=1033252 RepID=A0AAD7JFF8_9AGAR|nr:hypothetical protein B0H16DRAFT_1455073 [Mycena metata]